MKTAVSIPDHIFERAERLARRNRRTRSEVYAAALDEYVSRHAPDEITDTMNRVCEEAGDERDAFLAAAGRHALDSCRVVVSQGDICWAELPTPTGSGPGFRRPVVVIQGNALNRSRLATVVCIALTSNLRWAEAPGSVLLTAGMTRLSRDSVAHVSQVIALDRSLLEERVSRLSRAKIELLLGGVEIVLGR